MWFCHAYESDLRAESKKCPMPPPKKSAHERELTGNAGHHSKAENDAATSPPVPLVGSEEAAAAHPLGDAPAWLNDDARAAWLLAAPALQSIHLLSSPDRVGFSRYCEWLALWFGANRTTRGRGKLKLVETTRSKSVKMDRVGKSFQALLLLDKRLQDFEDRYGMNPEARQQILSKLAAGFGGGAQPPATPPGDDKPKRGPLGILNSTKATPSQLQ